MFERVACLASNGWFWVARVLHVPIMVATAVSLMYALHAKVGGCPRLPVHQGFGHRVRRCHAAWMALWQLTLWAVRVQGECGG